VTAILPAAVLPKLRKLIPLLAWDKGGEVVATAAISRNLRTANRGWHDLNAVLTEPRVVEREAPPRRGWRAPTPDAGTMLADLLNHLWLTDWESDFVRSVFGQFCRRRISAKQTAVLERIWRERVAA
jgi:hypothetical protein